MGQYIATSGIQVIDRAVAIIEALSGSPLGLNDLCATTGLPRATTHRLASALETHHILARTEDGRWTIGRWLTSFSAPDRPRLIELSQPIMAELMRKTGESVQLYQLTGSTRTCIAAEEPSSGLRHTVPVGSQLPLTSGSAAKVFISHAPEDVRDATLASAIYSLEELSSVAGSGVWESIAEREVGLASLSAPVVDSSGELRAVLSISGPAERLQPSPAAKWGSHLRSAAAALSALLD